ncbi:conserved hypothetical protein [Trichinella spiralis]|uniref:hypothetical protein n=1 Tax=Trichinella spiralis TaxID=6334 RepID=UPI0001EFE5E0|nr:conserved hypothetical protein [Trichinella spiralis]
MRSKCAITKISIHFAHYRNGLRHRHRTDIRSYSCLTCAGYRTAHTSLVVRVAISAFARSCSDACILKDKCCMTSNYGFRDSVKGNITKVSQVRIGVKISINVKVSSVFGEGYALGYASGKILKISNFLKYSPRLCPQAMPQGK